MPINYLKKRRNGLILALFIVIALLTPLAGSTVHAQDEPPSASEGSSQGITRKSKEDIYGTDCGDIKNGAENCEIIKMANSVVKFLSVVVGVVVTIMIIVGGIQYTTAGGDPNKVASAKNVIRNAIVALIAYIFLFAFLNWVVPGGLV